jgi:hypothetical protein
MAWQAVFTASDQKHSGVLNSPSIVLAISMSVLFFLSTTPFLLWCVGSGELVLDPFLLKKLLVGDLFSSAKSLRTRQHRKC